MRARESSPTTDSNVINVEGSYIVGNSWLTKIDYHFRDSDYAHTEQHAEEEGMMARECGRSSRRGPNNLHQ